MFLEGGMEKGSVKREESGPTSVVGKKKDGRGGNDRPPRALEKK